ncbi:Outer membrane protein beta-barrel domain-containing protein [Chitinophaga eiseniae]|uniref:Outer membrane protein beta-barrel domain-containing protein n=1 Tax=Chitinophaga eiseniae TaxID=634771 RepID=A0A1T4RTJ8_9BACT|nr:outer membrane beta-barrel protein [Chitinophaga eiseniae]SKA19088.1 Outer membrane protein beta-barrel domain-containing protein [Chitinophaga eiseniae]
MKKLIVMAAVALFGTQVAKAQLSKGDVILGGNVNVKTTSAKVKDSDAKATSTTFGVSPKVGVALNSNWVIGVFAQTQFGSSKDVNKVKTKTLDITPGVFVRNYHMIGQSKFAFFAEANAGYGFGNTKVADKKTESYNGFNVNVLPGITYFVTKNFMIEGAFGGLGYTYAQNKNEATGVKTNVSDFEFNFTKQLNLGVNFIF